MANQTRTVLKTYFNTGDKPTENNFVDLIDSNLNLTDGGTVEGATTFSENLTLGKGAKQALKVLTSQGTHTNTTTAAAAGATFEIPAGLLQAGNALHIKSFGRVTDNNGSDTLTPRLMIGTTAIATGADLNVDDGDLGRLDAWISIRGTGAINGKFVADGTFETDAAGGTKLLWTKSETALNTTIAHTIKMDFDWSAAHAENIYIQDQFIVLIY